MSRQLVVGLGNALAGDDGFGPAVVRLLQDGGVSEDVDLVPSCTDLLGQIDLFERYARVVLVDAVIGGGRSPGEVACMDEATLLDWDARSTSAHRLSPVEALRVFRALSPEAGTQVTLVALHTDRVEPERVHALPARVLEGARLVRSALSA
jgi:hydrogenase maturation protease